MSLVFLQLNARFSFDLKYYLYQINNVYDATSIRTIGESILIYIRSYNEIF